MRVRGDRLLRRAVATVLFVNAFLVFVLQPHISKRLLPVLGGSAEVWIVCSLFFQLALLAGYVAAYFARRLPLPASLALHAVLVIVAWLLWPFSAGEGPPLGCIAAALDLAGARWTTGAALHRVDGDVAPAADGRCARRAECGSLSVVRREQRGKPGGLVRVSLLVEPLLTLDAQARAWSAGALVLLALLALTGSGLVGSGAPTTARDVPTVPGPTARQRVRWLVLSLVPSVLLLAVTAQITTDIAPTPLLWTLPLGIYLASFIRVFSQGWQPSRWTWTLLAVFSLPMLLAFAFEPNQWFWVGVHLAILWCGAVLCHGALVQERPASNRLAEFYVWLAMGVHWAACSPVSWRRWCSTCAPSTRWPCSPCCGSRRRCHPAAHRATVVANRTRSGRDRRGGRDRSCRATAAPPGLANVFVLVPSVAAVVSRHRPRVFAACVTAALLAIVVGRHVDPEGTVLRGRTFYGTHSVRDLPDAHARALFHGTTLHGLQSPVPNIAAIP